MSLRYSVGNDTAGNASWWLYADNDQKVAWAGETLASTANARRAAESFKAGASSARFEAYKDAGGYWRWRAWRSSDKVAASGESFYCEADARRAADDVRDKAGRANDPQ